MAKKWKLDVQGVKIESDTPTVVVKDALVKAGFELNDSWNAILKISGEPRKPVTLTDTIDLTNPGVEKLRYRPSEINNGEAPVLPIREFRLLEKDESYLDQRKIKWKTIVEAKRRWLVLQSFQVPAGYNLPSVDIAIDVPPTYPASKIDMFFCHPHLALPSGGEPPKTTGRVLIDSIEYQQWSRHLNGSTNWNPATDSVRTHIALIEEALLREVPHHE